MKKTFKAFKIIGISVRTTNENGQQKTLVPYGKRLCLKAF